MYSFLKGIFYLLTLASDNVADTQETKEFLNGLQLPGRAAILVMRIMHTTFLKFSYMH